MLATALFLVQSYVPPLPRWDFDNACGRKTPKDERLKLFASFCNSVGASIVIAVIIVPVLSVDNHMVAWWQTLLPGLAMAIGCHGLGQCALYLAKTKG